MHTTSRGSREKKFINGWKTHSIVENYAISLPFLWSENFPIALLRVPKHLVNPTLKKKKRFHLSALLDYYTGDFIHGIS